MVQEQAEEKSTLHSLRDPADLMQPERLGALKQTRLSFTRLLMDRMIREQWQVDLVEVDLDEQGRGRAIYSIRTPSQLFTYAVHSQQIPEAEKTDRIIAETWDMWGFLCEGRVTPEFLENQLQEIPDVRAGRATPDVLIWTRANRSKRFFDHVVDSLAANEQPDAEFLANGGYLIRSSGYFGNGLNGTKVFEALDNDHPFNGPYMPQMFSAWMWRIFGYDLADQMAQARNPDAATLDRDIKRYLGAGNSSGVGLVQFVVNHPKLMHAWLRAREIALARTKQIQPTDEDVAAFERTVARARQWFAEDESDTKDKFTSKDRIARELDAITAQVDSLVDAGAESPVWADLCEWAESNCDVETQEVLHSLLLDVHPHVCNGLEESLITSEKTDVVPNMPVSRLRSLVTSSYKWALDIDMSRPEARHYFWYRSAGIGEPRLGIRDKSALDEFDEYGFSVDVAMQVQELESDLRQYDEDASVAEFLFDHPDHRYVVERVQNLHDLPYAEIRANPVDADFNPLNLISFKKSFWGIQKTHPKSIGWVRGTFFQGAPLPEDLKRGEQSYWVYPSIPTQADTEGEY